MNINRNSKVAEIIMALDRQLYITMEPADRALIKFSDFKTSVMLEGVLNNRRSVNEWWQDLHDLGILQGVNKHASTIPIEVVRSVTGHGTEVIEPVEVSV